MYNRMGFDFLINEKLFFKWINTHTHTKKKKKKKKKKKDVLIGVCVYEASVDNNSEGWSSFLMWFCYCCCGFIIFLIKKIKRKFYKFIIFIIFVIFLYFIILFFIFIFIFIFIFYSICTLHLLIQQYFIFLKKKLI